MENTAKNLSWREASIEVLKTSNKPMSTNSIVAAIKERGLRTVSGNTPEATVGALIYTSMQKDGESSPFIQTGSNEFAFKQPVKSVVNLPSPSGGIISNDDEEEPKKTSGIIRAFGMYWRRDFVYWKSAPSLLGRPSQNGDAVINFCNQRGVYFLHHGSDVIYVGRSLKQPLGSRLHQHTFDRHNGRWDNFSWFGLLNLSEDGKIIGQGIDAVSASGIDIIITMEALLIEGLEPKQNRKGGDTLKNAEYIQEIDPEIQRKKEKEIEGKIAEKIKQEVVEKIISKI
jgi:hypothetical protein